MAAGDELLGLYWTVSGPVEVHVGREWSRFDLRDRCAQAARVGMKGTGLWHADLEHVLETRTLEEVRQLFDDHGLTYVELEFLWEWFLDPSDERRQASDRTRALLFEAAAALPTHHIKVGNIPGTPCELPRLIDAYAELCADAATHTDARIVYEFMPFDVNVHDLDTALAVVNGADAPNGGLAIDTWHMSKLGITPDDLRRVPLSRLGWVELSDGFYENMDDLDRRDRQPPAAARRGRVSARRLHRCLPRRRLRRPVGRRGPVGGAPQPADRADLRPVVRDEHVATERRKERGCLSRAWTGTG